MTYSFVVIGLPASQGSKRYVGRGIMIESDKRLPAWRESVKWMAVQARGTNPPLDGPLRCTMIFTLPKPKSAPKARRTWPDKKPDLSKLVRSVEDALTDSGLIVDDARIVDYAGTRKCFPNEDPKALDVPGVRIELEKVA